MNSPFQTLASPTDTGPRAATVPHTSGKRWASGGEASVTGIGDYLDGWKDVLYGMALHAEKVATAFEEQIVQRQPPASSWQRASLYSSVEFVSIRRPYRLVIADTGATIAVYIGQFGNDLHVGWDLFVKPLWGWVTFAILFVIALVLSFLANSASTALLGAFQPRGPQVNWALVLGGAISQWIGLVLIVAVWGKWQRGSFRAPFLRERHFFESSDIGVLTIQVDKALRSAVDAAGLDATLLRTKEQFKAGRRDRLI